MKTTFDELLKTNDAQGIILTVLGIGYPAVFTNFRLDRATIPDGYFAYDLRESDETSEFCEIADNILVNHGGTVITKTPIDFKNNKNICNINSAYGDEFDYSFDDAALDNFTDIILA